MAATHPSGPVDSANGFAVNGVSKSEATTSSITISTGTTNTATLTIALKDAAGNALTKVTPFDVYLSDSATGIGITGTAASTGLSVVSGGGVRLVTAVTKSIACVSSATGTAVLSLLDTAKTGYYVVVAVNDSIKVSAQLVTGNYG